MESGSSIDCGDKRICYGKDRISTVKLYSYLIRVPLVQ